MTTLSLSTTYNTVKNNCIAAYDKTCMRAEALCERISDIGNLLGRRVQILTEHYLPLKLATLIQKMFNSLPAFFIYRSIYHSQSLVPFVCLALYCVYHLNHRLSDTTYRNIYNGLGFHSVFKAATHATSAITSKHPLHLLHLLSVTIDVLFAYVYFNNANSFEAQDPNPPNRIAH